ncbi:MAG: glycosyltransferase [Parcubacteria group bacterium]
MDINYRKKITVAMPVYNGEKYLAKAIDSVLAQTYPDFELVIVDDGSTDGSAKILEKYAAQDKRIRVLYNEKNMGIVFTRNRSFDESNSEYIAILDHDDIALPNRLKEQMDFLDSHQEFGMVGSWVEQIDENDKPNGIVWKYGVGADKIASLMLFSNFFAQSAVTIRKKALPVIPYRQDYIYAEDYDLWTRIAEKWKVWNLPKILIKYRVHTAGITKTRPDFSINAAIKLQMGLLNNLGLNPSEDDILIHRTNFTFKGENLKKFIDERENWLEKLIIANNKIGYYPKREFSEIVSERWLYSCDSNGEAGFWIWKKFWQSPLSKNTGPGDWKRLLKFFIKCLLKKNKFS